MSVIYNGVDLEETFGLTMLGRGTYGAAERDIEQIHVPGRNGDLLYDNGGFLNVEISYPCSITEDFAENATNLRNFLLSSPGYHKLTDSYHPGEYRMAEFRGPFEADVHTARNNDSANFELVFNCKPQRWLDDEYIKCSHCVKTGSSSSSPYSYTFSGYIEKNKTLRFDVDAANIGSVDFVYGTRIDVFTRFTPTYTDSGSVRSYTWTYTGTADGVYILVRLTSTAGDNHPKLYLDGTQAVFDRTGKGTIVENPYYFTAEPIIRVRCVKGTATALTCEWGLNVSGATVHTFTVDLSSYSSTYNFIFTFDSEKESCYLSRTSILSRFDGDFPHFESQAVTFLRFSGPDDIVVEVLPQFWRV